MLTFELVSQYLVTFILIGAASVALIYLVSSLRNRPPHLNILSRAIVALGTFLTVLAITTGVVFWQREGAIRKLIQYEHTAVESPSNLLADTFVKVEGLTKTLPVSPMQTEIVNITPATEVIIAPGTYIAGNVIPVQPGQQIRYSLNSVAPSGKFAQYQIRLLWYDTSLTLSSWSDGPLLNVKPYAGLSDDVVKVTMDVDFHTGVYIVPPNVTRVRLEVRNVGSAPFAAHSLKLSAIGAYVEQHPYGARGSVAFSFDWESAMGGPIHSRGMTEHNPASAAQHGLQMRQGADWLMALFSTYKIKGTFYATGYNFLDGNTDRRIFSGDPIYKWASPKNRWTSEHWLTHKWYGDDPFGTVETAPEWYFGDQTHALLEAGHEIAPHTFGHLYVRGSNPDELATDMDEWIAAADAVGVRSATTFAFPWRSSNSLTPDFYDVLYRRGIRAVTRIYERDLRELYMISAVPTYTQMLVMPDFRLEAPTSNVVEEAAGEIIGLERGTQVLDEVIARRGTTSFWTHPEQLADSSDFDQVKLNWRGVVSDVATRRDRGLLWIGTVAEIVAYQRDVMSVTTRLEPGFLSLGDWTLEVRNDSGGEIKGLTLTLPSEVAGVSSSSVQVATAKFEGDTVILSPANQPAFPARQLVLDKLPPGITTLSLTWDDGQEPPR